VRKGLVAGGMAFVLGAALAVSARAGAESVAPELSAAGWTQSPVSLEDLKGQVVVFVFYNDDAS
jgi:hypothetical protein